MLYTQCNLPWCRKTLWFHLQSQFVCSKFCVSKMQSWLDIAKWSTTWKPSLCHISLKFETLGFFCLFVSLLCFCSLARNGCFKVLIAQMKVRDRKVARLCTWVLRQKCNKSLLRVKHVRKLKIFFSCQVETPAVLIWAFVGWGENLCLKHFPCALGSTQCAGAFSFQYFLYNWGANKGCIIWNLYFYAIVNTWGKLSSVWGSSLTDTFCFTVTTPRQPHGLIPGSVRRPKLLKIVKMEVRCSKCIWHLSLINVWVYPSWVQSITSVVAASPW